MYAVGCVIKALVTIVRKVKSIKRPMTQCRASIFPAALITKLSRHRSFYLSRSRLASRVLSFRSLRLFSTFSSGGCSGLAYGEEHRRRHNTRKTRKRCKTERNSSSSPQPALRVSVSMSLLVLRRYVFTVMSSPLRLLLSVLVVTWICAHPLDTIC